MQTILHHNEGKEGVLAGIRSNWLAIANEVRNRIIELNENIYIPELSF